MKFLEMQEIGLLESLEILGLHHVLEITKNSALHGGVLAHCLWVTVVSSFLLLFVVLGASLIRFPFKMHPASQGSRVYL